VQADDVESFRRLVERYQRPLLTLVRNLTPLDTDHEGVAPGGVPDRVSLPGIVRPKAVSVLDRLFIIARNRCRNELARRRPVARR
jgi:hypothetical protein